MKTPEELVSRYATIDKEAPELRKRLHAIESEQRWILAAIGDSRSAAEWLGQPVLWSLMPDTISARLKRLLTEREITGATYADLTTITRADFVYGRVDLRPVADQLVAHLSFFGIKLPPDPKSVHELKLEREKLLEERKQQHRQAKEFQKAEVILDREREKQAKLQARQEKQRQAREEQAERKLRIWKKQEELKLRRKAAEQQKRERADWQNWRDTALKKVEERAEEQSKRDRANRRVWKEKQAAQLKQSIEDWKEKQRIKLAEKLSEQKKLAQKQTKRKPTTKKPAPKPRAKRKQPARKPQRRKR